MQVLKRTIKQGHAVVMLRDNTTGTTYRGEGDTLALAFYQALCLVEGNK